MISMPALTLLIFGVFTVFLVLGNLDKDDRRPIVGLHMVCWVILAGLLVHWSDGPEIYAEGGDLISVAQADDGQPVQTTVTFEDENQQRQIRSIAFKYTFRHAYALAVFAFGLSTLIVLIGWGRPGADRFRTGLSSLCGLHVIALAYLTYSIQSVTDLGGQERVRAFLKGFDPGQSALTSFTVPTGPWTYDVSYQLACIVALAASILCMVGGSIKPIVALKKIPITSLAVLVGLLTVAYQGAASNGFPWRPSEAALFAAVILAGVAAILDGSHRHLSVASLGSAVAVLALSVS